MTPAQDQPRAEGRPQPAPAESFPGEAEARRLIQELQLHRIELEMQNEELHRVQDELKAARARSEQQVQAHQQSELTLLDSCTGLEVACDRLRAEKASLQRELGLRDLDELSGPSVAVAALWARIEAAAALDAPVLVLGEPGSGKEAVARAIQRRGVRRTQPMLGVDCAELPEDQLEALLFGRDGQFELARQGTLFLNEVAVLSLDLQAMLLDALLRTGPTGAPEVLVIAASNRDLVEEVHRGRLRADLYVRLSANPVQVPPLRARHEDIPALVAAGIARGNRTLGRQVSCVPEPVLALLLARPWPGNLRELRSTLELALIGSRGPELILAPPGMPL